MSNTPHARAVADAMVALWEGEMPATLRVMSAVSDTNRTYRPDPKSRTTWQLLTHIATADIWFLESAERGTFQFDAAGTKQLEEGFADVAAVVAWYSKALPAVLGRLRALSDDELGATVDFFGMMQKTRGEWIGFANNHSVHHRGQLSTHLRAIGSRVPNIYGASADADTE